MMPSPRGDGMMHTPAIDLVHDLYVSPVEMGQADMSSHAHAEPVWLGKDEPVTSGEATYVFRGFRMAQENDHYLAYADIDVTVGGRTSRVSPGLRATESGTQPVVADVPSLGPLALARMNVDQGQVAILPPGAVAATPIVVVDLSTKPWVNLVWVGALLMLLGTAMAGLRRAREQTAREPRRVAKPATSGEASAGAV